MGQNAIYYKGKSYSGGGGGSGTEVIANPEDAATDTLTKLSVDGDVYGIKSYQEITKAEYDALPSSKLTDDILYCITDGGATKPGEYFNPVIYSTTEREIGVWTDGKPLYQRTMTIPIVNVQDFTLADDSMSYDKLICSNGIVYVDITNPTWVSHSSDRQNSPRIAILPDNKLYYYADNLPTEYNWMYQFTIQYTKTTDTPGSGKYTTLGVPSVHYSTDEQVIGTWIDGKPLYQKTIHTSGISIKLNGTYDFTSLFPLTNTVRDITVIGNYLDNDSPNYFSLGQYCGYFNPNEAPAHTLRLSMGSSTKTFEFFITIKYTKTTD